MTSWKTTHWRDVGVTEHQNMVATAKWIRKNLFWLQVELAAGVSCPITKHSSLNRSQGQVADPVRLGEVIQRNGSALQVRPGRAEPDVFSQDLEKAMGQPQPSQ